MAYHKCGRHPFIPNSKMEAEPVQQALAGVAPTKEQRDAEKKEEKGLRNAENNSEKGCDQFHESDHSKCSSACFLTNCMVNDPVLQNFKSSAGESGNAGLARIRKSASYCTQAHAILFLRHYLNVWNQKPKASAGNGCQAVAIYLIRLYLVFQTCSYLFSGALSFK